MSKHFAVKTVPETIHSYYYYYYYYYCEGKIT